MSRFNQVMNEERHAPKEDPKLTKKEREIADMKREMAREANVNKKLQRVLGTGRGSR